MVEPNLTFWSISRKKSLESQQKHAIRNRFLRTLLCSNDILNPGYNRKMLMRNRTSILDGNCFTNEQLFRPVQCTVWKICQCNSINKPGLPRLASMVSISDQFHRSWDTSCLGISARQNSTCLYQSWSLHIPHIPKHDKFQNLNLAWKRGIYYLQCSNSPWLEKKEENWWRVNVCNYFL